MDTAVYIAIYSLYSYQNQDGPNYISFEAHSYFYPVNVISAQFPVLKGLQKYMYDTKLQTNPPHV